MLLLLLYLDVAERLLLVVRRRVVARVLLLCSHVALVVGQVRDWRQLSRLDVELSADVSVDLARRFTIVIVDE